MFINKYMYILVYTYTYICTYTRPHEQTWLSWSERGTVNPQVVGSMPSKTRRLKFPWI